MQPNSMQQTFMSGPNNFLKPPGGQNETAYGSAHPRDRWGGSAQGTTTGFDNTQSTFKQRTPSVSKPVDRNLLDTFKDLIEQTRTNDWQKRVRAIDGVQQFAVINAGKIKQSPSSFIGLVDTYCQMLQDNNMKVLVKCQQSFAQILQTPELNALIVANLTMVIQALTTNLCSSSSPVRNEAEHLIDLIEMCCLNEARNVNGLVQPVVAQVNLSNCRAKAQLVSRLAGKWTSDCKMTV